MDRPFIKTICNAYHSDFELRDTSIWETIDDGTEELSNHIKTIVETLKLEDIEMYEELFTLSRDKQYSLIYNLLNEYMSETYSDVLPTQDPIYDDEELLEMIGTLTASTLMGITGLSGLGIAMIIGTLATNNSVTRTISRVHAKAATLVHNMTDIISKKIKNASLPGKVKNAMIYNNLDGYCGAKCGIPKGSAVSTKLTNLMSGRGSTDSDSQQAFKCLSNCYLQKILEGVEFLSKQYAACLMASGENIPLGKGPTILTTVLKNPIGEHCKHYFDTLNDLHKDWDEALKIVLKDDPRQLHEYTMAFLSAIEKGLHSNNQNRNFNTSTQRKPSYNKR